jgi:hypothetical protein
MMKTSLVMQPAFPDEPPRGGTPQARHEMDGHALNRSDAALASI